MKRILKETKKSKQANCLPLVVSYLTLLLDCTLLRQSSILSTYTYENP